ncbi:TIR domain-containing protein [Streptomyces sp. NPDC096205]|uniref:toll/interleukin-1 receptor domain-containing protein n=1 Tax=Streptomyces sp. NPDC096205 TaxID=3366081 RepID=UPI00380CB15F
MKVFLSWSGKRSQKMAEALKTWLPDVLQAVHPWISSQDISKGSRGLKDIADELAEVNFGIICVTAENQKSQWVNFEAGALSKQMGESLVVPLLLDIKIAELTGPLAQFQATESASKEDVYQLMKDINAALGDSGITSDRLSRAFDRYWPDLEEQLKGIRAEEGSGEHVRSSTDMLEELLVLIRQQERRITRLSDDVRILFQAPDPDRYIQIPAEDRVIKVEAARYRSPFEGMALAELQGIASALGIREAHRLRKSQIIKVVQDHMESQGLSLRDVMGDESS